MMFKVKFMFDKKDTSSFKSFKRLIRLARWFQAEIK